MKKWIAIITGLALLGAFAVEQLMIAPKTISSAEELLEIFFQTRTSLPPVPAPVSYEEVASQLIEDRYDFMANPLWAFIHDAGTYYLSDKSKLAKNLPLPVRLLAYEDLASGKVVLAASPLDSKDVQTLAVIDAPEFSAYDGKCPVESYLMREIWPRRIVWSALLKSEEDAWADLLSSQEQAAMAPAPMMMAMGMGESEPITDFRIVQDYTNLSVNLPVEFEGATIRLMRCTNLVEGAWSSVLQTNVSTSGLVFLGHADIPDLVSSGSSSTNSGGGGIPPPGGGGTNASSSVTNSTAAALYKVTASSTVDSDNDGLDNVNEYAAGTDYLDEDSEGDGLLDGQEVGFGLDPLKKDTDDDGTPDVFEVLTQIASNGVLIVLPSEQYRHVQESTLTLNYSGAYGD